jgi:hypothetical protein
MVDLPGSSSLAAINKPGVVLPVPESQVEYIIYKMTDNIPVLEIYAIC